MDLDGILQKERVVVVDRNENQRANVECVFVGLQTNSPQLYSPVKSSTDTSCFALKEA